MMRIAYHMIARLPSYIEVDDLIQAGSIGLIEAAKSYDESKGASFSTYAGIRIKGAMIDELRKGDWAPRSAHRFERQLNDTTSELEKKFSRQPTNDEIADALEISTEELRLRTADVARTKLLSLEDQLGVSAPVVSFDSQADKQLLMSKVQQAIVELPEREQLILSLYYFEELNLKEIGEIIEVSESRVSQLLSQVMEEISSRLQ